ncbi:hypothetical protein ABPG75_002569 [Micractinium tetrahymenae]
MAALPAAAGTELYSQRVAKASALPPEQRSADCAAFLAAHGLLEEAAAVLLRPAPPPAGPEPGGSSGQEAQAGAPGEEAARTLALLKWLSVGTGVGRQQRLPLPHPRLDSPAGAAAALAPLVTIRPAGGSGRERPAGSEAVQATPTPLAEQLLQEGEGRPPDLQQVALLLLLGRFWQGQGQRAEARHALAAAARAFGPAARSVRPQDAEAELAAQEEAFRSAMTEHRDEQAAPRTAADEAATAALAGQLAALQEASGDGWQVPTATELHGMLLHLRLAACMPEPGRQGSEERQAEEDDEKEGSEEEGGDDMCWPRPKGEAAVAAAQHKLDALALLALLPEDPRSHDWAAAVGPAAVGFQAHPSFVGMMLSHPSHSHQPQHPVQRWQRAPGAGLSAAQPGAGGQGGLPAGRPGGQHHGRFAAGQLQHNVQQPACRHDCHQPRWGPGPAGSGRGDPGGCQALGALCLDGRAAGGAQGGGGDAPAPAAPAAAKHPGVDIPLWPTALVKPHCS